VVARTVEGASAGAGGGEFRGARERLVETLRDKGIRDLSVLRAIEMTPRHTFVPTGLRHRAYEDAPLPIGNGQTISQPWVHARYLELLDLTGKERVLEIGTGSGYQTVLLAHLVAQVFSIERIPALLAMAREAIERSGVRNVNLLLGDGTVGWREYAPYDAILVGAGAPAIPQPLVDQLGEGGRLLIPIGDREEQRLVVVQRKNGKIEQREVAPVRFVPLLGSHGWGPDEGR
jgi:protein-L-isoaspartate(D-aspartate) O-methyltransferase